MSTLISMHFQGTPEVIGDLADAELDRIRRDAFPLLPRPDCYVAQAWRSYKLAPLPTGRLMFSVAQVRGEVDRFRRPVLSARVMVVSPAEMVGPLRDPVAAWRALEAVDDLRDGPAILRALEASSVLTDGRRFQRLVDDHRRLGPLLASTAAALCEPPVDLYLPSGRTAATTLRPVLILLPLARLFRLHLATGSSRAAAGEQREAVLGMEGMTPPSEPAPAPLPQGVRAIPSLLEGLLRREPPPPARPPPARSFDLVSGRASQAGAEGPRWLSDLLASDSQWLGLDPRDRLMLALECMDAGPGEGADPFHRLPALRDLRRIVREAEAMAQGLRRWS